MKRQPAALWLQWHKAAKRWEVRIRLQGIQLYVGQYATAVEAVVRRNEALQHQWGSLAEAWRLRRPRYKRPQPTQLPAGVQPLDGSFVEVDAAAGAGTKRSGLLEALENEMGEKAAAEEPLPAPGTLPGSTGPVGPL